MKCMGARMCVNVVFVNNLQTVVIRLETMLQLKIVTNLGEQYADESYAYRLRIISDNIRRALQTVCAKPFFETKLVVGDLHFKC